MKKAAKIPDFCTMQVPGFDKIGVKCLKAVPRFGV
ncbi:MAG: hypothetical protein C5S48_09735 [Candidatus Methanogaster sp.]|nr:MAG: hypothetical protein C5S48_09735 [ANME-2 cluster archaeon]